MRSIIGQCPDCCDCPAPTLSSTTITAGLVCEQATASKSKIGVGTVYRDPEVNLPTVFRGITATGEIVNLSPPAKYDEEGNLTGCDDCDDNAGGGFQANSLRYSGKTLVDREGNFVSFVQSETGRGVEPHLRCEIGEYDPPVDASVGMPGPGQPTDCGSDFATSHGEKYTYSPNENNATLVVVEGCGCNSGGTYGIAITTGSHTFEFTDEFTTEDLIAYAADNLSDYASGGCYSSLVLSSNEVSVAIHRLRYKISLPASDEVAESVDFLVRLKKTFTPADGGTPTATYANVTVSYDGTAKESDWFELMEPDTPGTIALTIERGVLLVTSFKFPVPKVGSGKCYKLTWKKRTTPIDGGDPTDEDEDWKWDGDIPEDYDPEDEDTWPMSPTYYYPTPEDGGIVSVEEVEAKCTGCAT